MPRENELRWAALDYARRGMAVIPCSPVNKRPLLPKIDGEAKTGGLKRASTSEEVIDTWWKKWPKAMIGMPMGEKAGAFVVDLDLGDPVLIAGAAYLDRLREWMRSELGEELPPDVPIVETGSGGYHLWFAWEAAHPVGNRGNLIKALAIEPAEGTKAADGGAAKAAHIDVRGEGGYVIVPPSVRADGRAYSFAQGAILELPACPPKLLALIAKEQLSQATPAPGAARPQSKAPSLSADDAVRRYALAGLDAELQKVRQAVAGTRNETLNEAGFKIGQLVGAGVLSEMVAIVSLDDIASGWPDLQKSQDTIRRAIADGRAQPRDLRPIVTEAERRASRSRQRGARLTSIDGGKGKPTESALPAPAKEPPRQLEMREILREQRKRLDPPPMEKRNGVNSGPQGPRNPNGWTADIFGLPYEDPCPVIPLGIDGRKYYFLDSAGQDTSVGASALNQAGIQDLFAATPNYVEWMAPRWGEKKIPDPDNPGEMKKTLVVASHQGDDVRKLLFRACVRKGHFDPAQKIRGRGGWKRADGAFLYHAGEELWIVEGGRVRAIETGLIREGGRELVYPRRPSLAAPHPHPVTAEDNPCRALIEGFRRWNWERPEIAPVLLLGWIGSGFLGGALDWRSQIFLIGDYGTGKSTLQRAIKEIFGEALLDSVNASPAYVYQSLAHDTRPVALDEFEGSSDNRRAEGMVQLARQGSSGGSGGRGTADAATGGVSFEIRSAFLFSCITNPPLLPQDLSRNAILRLRDLPTEVVDEKGERRDKPITINADTCGRMVLAQLMSQWHRFDATLTAYKKALEAGGHSGRGQDTYGHLLACADLMLGPELAEALEIPMVDDVGKWSELLHIDTLPEVQDAQKNWRACINHMLQNRVEVWRSGERATVGQLLEDFFNGDFAEHGNDKHVRRQLGQAGLGFVWNTERGWLLAVPSQSPILSRLFYGSRWQGAPGAGGWSEALRQAPGDVVWFGRDAPRPRINGVQDRCALVVLKALGLQEPRAAGPSPAPAPRGGE